PPMLVLQTGVSPVQVPPHGAAPLLPALPARPAVPAAPPAPPLPAAPVSPAAPASPAVAPWPPAAAAPASGELLAVRNSSPAQLQARGPSRAIAQRVIARSRAEVPSCCSLLPAGSRHR